MIRNFEVVALAMGMAVASGSGLGALGCGSSGGTWSPALAAHRAPEVPEHVVEKLTDCVKDAPARLTSGLTEPPSYHIQFNVYFTSGDEHQVCAFCGKQATGEYVRAGRTFPVCADCGDRRKVQDAYEDELVQISSLERRGQYDEALARLDTILESNRDRDHEGWLARSIGSHRALTLLDAGRFADAEQAYDARARLGFADVSERWEHALGMARTLEGLSRPREAMAVLEEALTHQDTRYLPSALGLLAELGRLSGMVGQAVDAKWLRVAEAVAERYGVAMPVADSPGQALVALAELARSMKPRRPKEGE